MTNTAALPQLTGNQFKTAVTVLGMIALSANGEVSEFEARTNGAQVRALAALVSKGLITVRRGEFTMPTGPLAGTTLQGQAFYSVP